MSLSLGLTNIRVGNESCYSGRPIICLHLVHGMLFISRYLCTWSQCGTVRSYLTHTEFVQEQQVI
jgi:hypothetical protein